MILVYKVTHDGDDTNFPVGVHFSTSKAAARAINGNVAAHERYRYPIVAVPIWDSEAEYDHVKELTNKMEDRNGQ